MKKPEIDELFQAFRLYQLDLMTAHYSDAIFRVAQQQLKERLEKLGIADMFQW